MKQLFLKSSKYFLIFIIVLISMFSCEKINNSPIPEVYVSFTVDLRIENELTVPGNAVFFPGVGYGGVIIYCEQPGTYYAFDAACTNEASRSCIVTKDEEFSNCPCLFSNFIVTCTCCGSQYLTVNGTVVKGPASVSLKQYNVSVLDQSVLRIYN